MENIRARAERTRGAPVSDSQILLKFLRQKDILVVTCVLFRYNCHHTLSNFFRTSSKVERIQEYLDIENVPDLTPEETEEIEATGAQLHRRFYVSWS